MGFPARDPNAIGVGASTDQADLAYYSNVGSEVDFVAPSSGGVLGIFTTDVSVAGRGFNVGRADKGGKDGLCTSEFGGTSSATPLAAGVAALVLSANPKLGSDEVRGILRATATRSAPATTPTASARASASGGSTRRKRWPRPSGWPGNSMRVESEPSRRQFLAAAAGAFAAGPGASAAGERGATDAAGVRRVELPGLVDLQVNGFAGVDFGDPATTPDDVERAVAAIQKTGVTRFLPTLITSSFETFAACAQTLLKTKTRPSPASTWRDRTSRRRTGRAAPMRARTCARADLDDFKRRQDAADGKIRLVTVAPESPGAIALVERLVAGGLRVAVGHTAASGAQIQAAVAAGATLSTHLGNGCAGMLPRHPNVIWEQLGEDRLLASFIVDGHHLPPATVRSMVRAKTPARTILVTDAMAAAGMPPGVYTIGGQKVELDASGKVAAPGASNLAGSALTLSAAIGHAVRFTGLPLDDVVEMASGRPAGYLGIPPAGRVTAEWDPAASELRVLRVSL